MSGACLPCVRQALVRMPQSHPIHCVITVSRVPFTPRFVLRPTDQQPSAKSNSQRLIKIDPRPSNKYTNTLPQRRVLARSCSLPLGYIRPVQLCGSSPFLPLPLAPLTAIPCSLSSLLFVFFSLVFHVWGGGIRKNATISRAFCPPPAPADTPRDHRGPDGRERRQVRRLHGKHYQSQGGCFMC